jgi:hypothetical protein
MEAGGGEGPLGAGRKGFHHWRDKPGVSSPELQDLEDETDAPIPNNSQGNL